MTSRSADAARNRSAGQARIRRNCTCGRVIFGNVGWWSHTHTKDGQPREDHKYAGSGIRPTPAAAGRVVQP